MVGNQEDVDAINQVTLEMDAAFGVGNWGFDENISIDSPAFENVQGFNNYLNSIEKNISFIISPNDPRITLVKIDLGFHVINIQIKQVLGDSENYQIISITSSLSGFVLTAGWEQTNYTNIIHPNNTATINVYGDLKYKAFIEGIGTFYTEQKQYKIRLNTTNGVGIDVVEIEN